jgi:hypothetical protein
MRALGRDDLPSRLAVSCRTLRRLATAKHDFWAATGFYEDDSGGRAVLKAYRTTRFAGAPLGWLGRWQCAREVALYRHLAGLSGVPMLLDRVGETAYLRAFVAGHSLSQARRPRRVLASARRRDARGALPRRGVRRREQAGEHPGRRRRPPVPDRLSDRVEVRAARESRARPLVAGAAAT